MHVVLDLPSGGQLWLGGGAASGQITELLDNGIAAILAAAAYPPVVHDSRIERLGTYDGTGLAAGDIDKGLMIKVFQRMLRLLAAGRKILVSCKNGAHRSSFVLALFLIFLTGCPPDDVHTYLNKLRGLVDLGSMAPESKHSRERRPNVVPINSLRNMHTFFSAEGLRSLSALSRPAQLSLGFRDAENRVKLNMLMSPADFEAMARSLGWVALSEARECSNYCYAVG